MRDALEDLEAREETKTEVFDYTANRSAVIQQQKARPRDQHDLLNRAEHLTFTQRGATQPRVLDTGLVDSPIPMSMAGRVDQEIKVSLMNRTTDGAAFSNQMTALSNEIIEERAKNREKNKLLDQAIAYAYKNKWHQNLKDARFQVEADPFALENTAMVLDRSAEDQDILEPPFPKATLDAIEKIVKTFPLQAGVNRPPEIFT